MKKKNTLNTSEIAAKLARNKQIYLQETAEERQRRRKLNELRRRLLVYGAKIRNNDTVSITLANYANVLERDPDCSILISDLNMKIQFTIL